MDNTDGQDPKTDQDGNEGQVSETASEFGEPISSGDSVAGQPGQESGEVDEGAQGPNAIPDDPTGEHPHKP
ncbi:hypothetical protein CFI00_07190 [Nocardioides sp. S5]|uniref:hypothetical protein n=1 Tax=Nocardioides sp. S5 TaxID=2017486 RepID=UPI001A8CF821|nr:hypothetical protein [Nocardioides sp. S5]QSR30289.1 hypothetical protein CFI00_07190 [Nocardioides sp. S5]